jgi:HCOMODA/2-hydroxy-3-carboxy-muconic semialdehyde decarboxylase
MRGHGSTSVGASIPQAVYRSVYTEVNAKVQTTASALGPVTFLSEEEALASEATSYVQVERTWDFWLSECV